MPNTDHTPEIFAALGITPETQPKLFYRYRSPTMENPETQKPISLIHTAGHELRADGLAVRLVEIARREGDILGPVYAEDSYKAGKKWVWGLSAKGKFANPIYRDNFAHAVHDALVEALGIGDKKDA